MKQDKELLLKDLCARLPYGVRCSFGVDDAVYEICGINSSCCGASEIQATHIKSGINGDFKLTSCKPYLFPLSSMTKEQYDEMRKLISEDYQESIQIAKEMREKVNFITIWPLYSPKVIDWFYRNHLDYSGLIEKGLAIDCTNLNIY